MARKGVFFFSLALFWHNIYPGVYRPLRSASLTYFPFWFGVDMYEKKNLFLQVFLSFFFFLTGGFHEFPLFEYGGLFLSFAAWVKWHGLESVGRL